METFADTSAFNAGVKEKNTKTNKITISESNLHFPHPAFGRSGCRLSNSTVIFLPDVSDVWRRPNPVKPLNVNFLLQNPQWNQLQLLRIKNLQHKTSFLTCIYIFPLVTYKDFSFYGKYA
jgi:hypothetical protein